MRVTLLQQDIVWANPKANAEKALEAIEANPGSDLYVLPEMWSTGFATEPKGIAEETKSEGAECESLDFMIQMANKTNAAIAGSVAFHAPDGTFRNRFYFVKPGGDVSYYDKHHLFTYSGEHLRFAAGNKRVVVEWKGIRFLLLVCYDLRFPIWARNHEDYDAIIYVASWPKPRVEAWRTLLKARAIENQCYVLGVNRVGTDPACVYVGGTAFVDPYGVASECPDSMVSEITKEIDMIELDSFRKKFPVLKDRD